VTFIDTERFDQQLSTLMRDDYVEIQIAFFGAVSINHMPARLQSWLSHIDKFGHGYEVDQTSSELAPKSIGLTLALILKAIPFIKDNYRGELSRPYKASLLLADNSDSLDTIILSRIANGVKKPGTYVEKQILN